MPKKINIYLGTAVVLIVAIVLIVASTKKQQQTLVPEQQTTQTETSQPTEQQTAAPEGSSEKTYSQSEVASHNTTQDCWASINGGVYDLTAWVSVHPGGPEAIGSLCGTDGSEAFNGQHGGQGDPMRALATFKIGTLVR